MTHAAICAIAKPDSNFEDISMRMHLPLLLVPAIVAIANASPRISGLGFTLVAAKGWDDKTSGAEISLRNGDAKHLRATLIPDFADRVSTSVKTDAACLSIGTEFAKTFGAEHPKPARAYAAKRKTCEFVGTLGGLPALTIMIPIGKTAAVVICFGPKTSTDWHADCRTMAGSIAIAPKSKPAPVTTPGVTTSKLPSGGTRIRVANAQFDLPAGWEHRASTADQIFAALKGDAVFSVSRIPRLFKNDTEANCSKLAVSAAKAQNAKVEGRLAKLNVGPACTLSMDYPLVANLVAYVNGPGPDEHLLFSCLSTSKDLAIIKECGSALGTLAFDKKQ